ncbi:MaoC/PaaZ C-terminal domain-containing protein [Mesorhizobium sp.]|uniref:MaoC family dehydratase n=1 Tax=Mesorhizobium sp. TaxID=1871066 RepID=UPI000FEAA38F|nr:MaoC/PaaZ C-terminal domain-containing protein [Mesorhizobium sp.]RWI88925.1 MAG: dehydratase [Mesorhizobium sp.]
MSENDDLRIAASIKAIPIGKSARYRREVTADLIKLYAEVSGDFHRLHVDEDYAKSTPYERRIAHGSLLVGFMSTASTALSEVIEEETGCANVSLGYDRLRFIAPVFVDDVIDTDISVTELLPDRGRALCAVTCKNQAGEVVAVAQHLMRFI